MMKQSQEQKYSLRDVERRAVKVVDDEAELEADLRREVVMEIV